MNCCRDEKQSPPNQGDHIGVDPVSTVLRLQPGNSSAMVAALLLILLLPASTLLAEVQQHHSPAAIFERANSAYNAGNASQAILLYEEIVHHHGLSAPLLYNLGNSYAQTGQTGKAVLNYERALRMAPGDPDITANLQVLRNSTTLFLAPATIPQQLFRLLSLDQWTVVGLLALIVLSVLHLLEIFHPGKKTTKMWSTLATILVISLASMGAFSRYEDNQRAVVIQEEVRLLLSPFAAAASQGALQAGRLVTPLRTHADYCLVKDDTGRSGWIEAEGLEYIMPTRNVSN